MKRLIIISLLFFTSHTMFGEKIYEKFVLSGECSYQIVISDDGEGVLTTNWKDTVFHVLHTTTNDTLRIQNKTKGFEIKVFQAFDATYQITGKSKYFFNCWNEDEVYCFKVCSTYKSGKLEYLVSFNSYCDDAYNADYKITYYYDSSDLNSPLIPEGSEVFKNMQMYTKLGIKKEVVINGSDETKTVVIYYSPKEIFGKDTSHTEFKKRYGKLAFELFDKNGYVIKSKGSFLYNLKDGEWKYYSVIGKLQTIETYEKGKLITSKQM